MTENKDKSKFAATLGALYPIKTGYWSMTVDQIMLEKLSQVKKGGRILIKIVPQAVLEQRKENSPPAYLEFLSAEQLAAFPKRTQQAEETTAI
jgi:hypothetical protein